MQITRPRGNFIEKIIRDTNGRLVRASFCVYENGGHIKARLLSVVYINENSGTENKTPILDCLKVKEVFSDKVYFENKTVSPYFSKNLLYSFGSKPRAPTL